MNYSINKCTFFTNTETYNTVGTVQYMPRELFWTCKNKCTTFTCIKYANLYIPNMSREREREKMLYIKIIRYYWLSTVNVPVLLRMTFSRTVSRDFLSIVFFYQSNTQERPYTYRYYIYVFRNLFLNSLKYVIKLVI